MKMYALILSVAFMGGPVFASDGQNIPEQNPLCPKKMTEEIYNQLNAGTYPGVQGTLGGLRHGHPGFKWDVPGLVLEQGNLHDLGKPEDSKNVCYYVEARSPKNNLVLAYLKQ